MGNLSTVRLTHLVLIIGLGLVGCASCASVQPHTIAYEPIVVTLTGTLTIREVFGPPNYGETPDQDAREKAYILAVNAPVSINADPNSEVNRDSFMDLRQIQLAPMPGVSVPQEWAGVQIVATGTIFQAITGHHVTNVVMSTTRIEQVPTK